MVGLIQDVQISDRVANPVMVQIRYKPWYHFIKNAISTCLKESLPSQRIGKVSNTTLGHYILGFLDTYFAHHQCNLTEPRRGLASPTVSPSSLPCHALWATEHIGCLSMADQVTICGAPRLDKEPKARRKIHWSLDAWYSLAGRGVRDSGSSRKTQRRWKTSPTPEHHPAMALSYLVSFLILLHLSYCLARSSDLLLVQIK